MVALAGLAVPAAAGCVSVDSPPGGAGGRSAPAVPSAGAAREQPQFVRPSAREMLSAPAPAHSSPGDATKGSSPAPRPAATGQTGRHGPKGRTRSPGRPATPRGHSATPAPVVVPPPLPRLPTGTGVCDLGRAYGQWRDGGDAARICEDAYGR